VRLRCCVYFVLVIVLGGCGASHEKEGQGEHHTNTGSGSPNTLTDSPPTVTGGSQGRFCRDVSSLKSFGRLPCSTGATYILVDPGSCSASLDSAGYYGVSSGASYPCSFRFKANLNGMTVREMATVTHP
jgi:hypothetical protein